MFSVSPDLISSFGLFGDFLRMKAFSTKYKNDVSFFRSNLFWALMFKTFIRWQRDCRSNTAWLSQWFPSEGSYIVQSLHVLFKILVGLLTHGRINKNEGLTAVKKPWNPSVKWTTWHFIHGKYPLSEWIKLLLWFDIVGSISVSIVHVDDLPLPLF